MRKDKRSQRAFASPSPAARRASGWRWSGSFYARAPASPSSPAPPSAVATDGARAPASTGSSATSAARRTSTRSRCRSRGSLGGLDVLINNASSLGPMPLALLADTECEELEKALAVNLVGPFRLTKALFGALAPSARERRGGARAQHLQRRGGQRLCRLGRLRRQQGGAPAPDRDLGRGGGGRRRALPVDRPGDMDTPLHALAVPDADPTTLKRPEQSAAEIIADDRSRRCRAAPARRRSARMMAADRTDRTVREAAQPRVRTAACGIVPRSELADARSAPAIWSSPTMRRPCRRASAARMRDGRADRGAAGGVDVARRSDALRRRRLRGRRSSHAHGGPAASAAALAAATCSRSGPLDATVERLLGHPRLLEPALRGTPRRHTGRARAPRAADPVCARPPSRWRSGTSGRRSPPTRSRSSRRRRALRSTGACSRRWRRARRRVRHADARRRDFLDRRSRRSTRGCRFDEPYPHPGEDRGGDRSCEVRGGRVIAIGTTVVRALEAAAEGRRRRACGGRRRHRTHRRARRGCKIVDAILSGVHAAGRKPLRAARRFRRR